jgi:hypothetical protein
LKTGADGSADQDIGGHLRIPPAPRQDAIPGDDGVRPARAQLRFQRQVDQEENGRREEPVASGGHRMVDQSIARQGMNPAGPAQSGEQETGRRHPQGPVQIGPPQTQVAERHRGHDERCKGLH